MIHKDDNKFSVLTENNDDEAENMTVEQLRERAARKNREREEKTQEDLDKRNRAISKLNDKAKAEPLPQELHVEWKADLPHRYSDIQLIQLPDSKLSSLVSLVKPANILSKSKDLEKLLEGAKQAELPTMVYHIMNTVLRQSPLDDRYMYSVAMFLTRVKDIVNPTMIENGVQKCYLKSNEISSDVKSLEEGFAALTKVLADNDLIIHLPSLAPSAPTSQPEPSKEEKAPEKGEEQVEAVAPVNEEKFIDLLKTNKMGEELSEEAAGLNLTKDPHLMFTLLEFIVGSHNPMDFVTAIEEADKDSIYKFIPFSMKNYGDLIYTFWDSQPPEVHVKLLNECVNYWDSVGQPQHLIGAMFYSIFEDGLVYEDVLSMWMEQDKTPLIQKALVSMNNTIFQIQEMLNSNQEEYCVCKKQE